MSVWGEPGSRRRARWDLVLSLATVVAFASLLVPGTLDGRFGSWGWILLPLLAWAVVVNVHHALRALRRLREGGE